MSGKDYFPCLVESPECSFQQSFVHGAYGVAKVSQFLTRVFGKVEELVFFETHGVDVIPERTVVGIVHDKAFGSDKGLQLDDGFAAANCAY